MEEKETDEEYVKRINGLSDEEVGAMIARDECPYEPERLQDAPIGMFHCHLCGEMVLAGLPHPRKSDLPIGDDDEDWKLTTTTPT